MEKRICLLAGYDKNNVIQDYVVFLVQELSKISDVYYFADGNMPEKELAKIEPYTKYAKSADHKGPILLERMERKDEIRSNISIKKW